MTRILVVSLAALLLVVSPAFAKDEDPAFLKNFFAPDLVLQNASAIGLERSQRDALLKDIGSVTGATTELQLSMLEHFGAVGELSAAETIDEQALLAAIRQVLSTEMRVKEAHMGLLIRIRNLLTPEQREKLRAIRDGAP